MPCTPTHTPAFSNELDNKTDNHKEPGVRTVCLVPFEATGMMGDLGGTGGCQEKRLKVGNNNVFDAALALVGCLTV